VAVANDMDGTANITLTHRHSDSTPEQKTWNGLGIGQAGEPLEVHYQTGLFSEGYWKVQVEVTGGRAKGYGRTTTWSAT
jgi:hypothetical protein